MTEIPTLKPRCGCIENILKDHKTGEIRRIPISQYHNCGYVDARNRLIPVALLIARDRARTSAGIVNDYTFTKHFSREMDRLSALLLA